jgi:hypothetical protein
MAQNVRGLIFTEAEMKEAFHVNAPAPLSNDAAQEQKFMNLLPDLPNEDKALLDEYLSQGAASKDEYPWMANSRTDWINEAVNEIERGPLSRLLDLTSKPRIPGKQNDQGTSEQRPQLSPHEQDVGTAPCVLRLNVSASERNRAMSTLGGSQIDFLHKANVLDLTLPSAAAVVSNYPAETSFERGFPSLNPAGCHTSTSDQSLNATASRDIVDVNVSTLMRGTNNKDYTLDQLKKVTSQIAPITSHRTSTSACMPRQQQGLIHVPNYPYSLCISSSPRLFTCLVKQQRLPWASATMV